MVPIDSPRPAVVTVNRIRDHEPCGP
jgi:hypothetical protein